MKQAWSGSYFAYPGRSTGTVITRPGGAGARWGVTSSGSDTGQCHVKSEFYAAGIGWVPCEASGAISSHYTCPDYFFGYDDGWHLAMHVEGHLAEIIAKLTPGEEIVVIQANKPVATIRATPPAPGTDR